MPPVLFLFETKETGEFEVGDKGTPEPIVDQIPHRYVDLNYLFEKFDELGASEMKDQVRLMLGFEKEKIAKELGEQKLNTVLDNSSLLNTLETNAKLTQLDRVSKLQDQLAKQLKDLKESDSE